MATLYTPAAKTTGLDWLAGMVQNGQQLWQQERRLAQDAQRIQLAKKQQEIQVQQFWAQQAKLADQEDFQNRKFLYQMSDDTRKFEWGKTVSDRNYQLQQAQESRLSEGQGWEMDPQNPTNRYREAATAATSVGMAQDLQEMEQDAAPAQWGTSALPGDDGSAGGTSTSLFEPTGDRYAPGVITLPSGQKAEIVATSIDKKGRPTSYSPRIVPPPDTEKGATWEDIRNKTEDNLSSLTKSLTPLPQLPDNPTPEQMVVREAQVRAIKAANAPVERQIKEITKRLDLGDRKERISNLGENLSFVSTEKFQNVFPFFMDAIKRQDPIALENLRVQIQPLAVDGDPSAKQALKILDDVLDRESEEGKGLRTGPERWQNLKR